MNIPTILCCTVNQTTSLEITSSGHHYVGELESYSNVSGMVLVELIAACILEKEKVDVLLCQQGQEG